MNGKHTGKSRYGYAGANKHAEAIARLAAIGGLRTALRVHPNRGDVAMMTWPGLAIELKADLNVRLAVLGYVGGGWIRAVGSFDHELIEPHAVERWLQTWAPGAWPTHA